MQNRCRQWLTDRVLLVALGVGSVVVARTSVAANEGALGVVLRDGEHVRGELLSLNHRETNIRDASARTVSFRTDAILKLDSRVPYAVETEAGERLKGKISIRNERRGQVVYVATAEPRRLPLASVVSIGPVTVPTTEAQDEPRGEAAQRLRQGPSIEPEKPSPTSPKPTGEASIAVDKDSKDPKDRKSGKAIADEEDAHSLFLRQVSVLLASREIEIDLGFLYVYDRSYDPTQNRLTYSRDGQASLALSFGIASFLQATISAPLVLNQEHTYSYADSREEASMSVRPGNVTGGINVQLLRAARSRPDVMLTAGLSLPLGSTSTKSVDQSGRVHLGSRAVNVAVSVVKTSDPISIVVSASYGHLFDETIAGQLTQSGDFWGYMFGLGFAVNTKVSLLTNVHGGWQAPSRLAGKRIVDSEAEPMTISTGMILCGRQILVRLALGYLPHQYRRYGRGARIVHLASVLTAVRTIVHVVVSLLLSSLCALHAQDSRGPLVKPIRTWKSLHEDRIVMQSSEYSCGAAAVATLLTYTFDDPVPETAIMDTVLKTLPAADQKDRKKQGFSLLDLADYLTARGYEGTAFRLTLGQLQKIQLPVLVHLSVQGDRHFVVLRKIRGDQIYLADPSRGNLRLAVDEFASEWTAIVLVVTKPGWTPRSTTDSDEDEVSDRMLSAYRSVVRGLP